METFVVYLNEREQGWQHILPMLDQNPPARWVLVGCPPRMNRHIGRWLSQSSRQRWRQQWSEQTLGEIATRLRERGDRVTTRVADGPLVRLTHQLRKEFGNLRIIDARRVHLAQDMPPVAQEQAVVAQPQAWAVPIGAVALGTVVALASE
jgi:hypothetical protein